MSVLLVVLRLKAVSRRFILTIFYNLELKSIFLRHDAVQWLNRPLAWETVYCASNCTDFSNFIFAIKRGGLEKTLEV